MINVQDTHRQAMEKADKADAANRAGDVEEARILFREACGLESVAAQALINRPEIEPTRSVLFRSAASLAIDARQFAHASYLVARGLDGSPPEEIREELSVLLPTIRHEAAQERLFSEELGHSRRVDRYLSSRTHLRAAEDRVEMALADEESKGREPSRSVILDILDSTQDSLREFTGDTNLSVDLLSDGETEGDEWDLMSPADRLPNEWFQFARVLVLEHVDTLFQANPVLGRIDKLRSLSEDCFALAQEAGVHALAAEPVRAFNKKREYRPAIVLLSLASRKTAFDDELAYQLLLEASCSWRL